MLTALARFLLDVEEASSNRAGARSLFEPGATEPLGTVMMERGRLCWATARENPVRLGDLIAGEAGLDRDHLRSLYDHCRTADMPFGECLVSRGLLEAVALRRMLLQQIVGALSVLLRASAMNRAQWNELREAPGHTYSPSFTFSGPEVATAYLDHDLETALQAPAPPPIFLESLERIPTALCLLRVEADPPLDLPVGLSSNLDLQSHQLQELTRVSRNLLLTPALVATGIRPFLTYWAPSDEDSGLLVARADPHLLVAQPRETQEFVSVLKGLRAWRDRASSPSAA